MSESPKTEAQLTDADLLRLHLGGDPKAFAAILNRYRRELYNFLVRFLGDEALAEDVFQETFLQLYLSAATFDLSKQLKPWLFTIAANKGRDAMRSRWRRKAAPLDARLSGEPDEGTSYGDLMPANVPPPDESLMNSETRSAVQKIVQEMPESLRIVLLLSYFHEFPYKEIADMLGVPLGTVKSRLHAAVRHFAKQWKATAEELDHGRTKTQ